MLEYNLGLKYGPGVQVYCINASQDLGNQPWIQTGLITVCHGIVW